ncbi:MAG: glycosyltransferase family 4 protein [Alicyclobacillus sp.]|nr:glycosyltransferase family 4 protein [Alicyclobacillus sp.]
MICFAVLAHQNEPVLQDQVDNLLTYHPGAKVVVYNGGTDPNFGRGVTGIDLCPYSRPLRRGKLARFLLDVMRWIEEQGMAYDYLVSVDSDVMFIRPGFEAFLDEHMVERDCMGINMGVQHRPDEVPHWHPGQTMWAEWDLWRPFFGIDSFCGTLNCMQVYRRDIVRRILARLDWDALERLLASTKVFALEEILHATLALREGARVCMYPQETAKYVRIGEPYTVGEVEAAFRDPAAYFLHPVRRIMDDPARRWIRQPAAPACLYVVWACHHGGVETALWHRLSEMDRQGVRAHVHFYYPGRGLEHFRFLSHQVSADPAALLNSVRQGRFDAITFVNTLHNFDRVIQSGYEGLCLFEFHGFAPLIAQELERINNGEDGGRIRAVVVPGDYVAVLARSALWKRPDLPVYVARNTLDTERFRRRGGARMPVPSDWDGARILGFVGRIEPNKGWRLMLEVFWRAKDRYPELKLLVASDTDNSPELGVLEAEVGKRGFQREVCVLSNVPYSAMPDFYSHVANSGGVLLSTSLSEGYPYHLLEAQACECPVVSTLAGGTAEVVAHGSTGFLFHTRSAEEAIQYVDLLFRDPEVRRRIVSQAREKVCSQQSVPDNVRAYIRFLKQLQ